MYVKGSGSCCVLGQHLKVKNYASFHTHSYHGCIEMHLSSRFEVNFDSHWRIKCFCFVLFLFSLTSLSRLFHSYGEEPIGRWGETGVPRKNHLKHPQAELGLFHMWPVRGSNLHQSQRRDDRMIKSAEIQLPYPFGHRDRLGVKCSSRAPGHGVCSMSVSRAISMQGFIVTAITATEKCTLILDNIDFDKVSEA